MSLQAAIIRKRLRSKKWLKTLPLNIYALN